MPLLEGNPEVNPEHPGASLAPIGWDHARARELESIAIPGVTPARITRVDRGAAIALTPAGQVRVAAGGLAAGDWVALDGDTVAAVMERRTVVARRAAGRADAAQVMASNVNLVVAVHGLDRPLRERRLHRAAALAWEAGATTLVALTKADLAGRATAEAQIARALPGVDVISTSASTGEGLDLLRARARPDRTLVLVGESGAGKSSLTNALLGVEALAVGDVRAGDAKGRHTTTARHLVGLPGGGALIDTPGIRELGLWGGEEAVAATFADIDALAARCRFADCGHLTEPGCAVLAAVAGGRLEPERLESFRGLTREVRALERRADERAHRAAGRRGSLAYRDAARRKRGGRGG